MMSLTEAECTVNEGTTFRYTCYLKDETGAAVALAVLNSLTLSTLR